MVSDLLVYVMLVWVCHEGEAVVISLSQVESQGSLTYVSAVVESHGDCERCHHDLIDLHQLIKHWRMTWFFD